MFEPRGDLLFFHKFEAHGNSKFPIEPSEGTPSSATVSVHPHPPRRNQAGNRRRPPAGSPADASQRAQVAYADARPRAQTQRPRQAQAHTGTHIDTRARTHVHARVHTHTHQRAADAEMRSLTIRPIAPFLNTLCQHSPNSASGSLRKTRERSTVGSIVLEPEAGDLQVRRPGTGAHLTDRSEPRTDRSERAIRRPGVAVVALLPPAAVVASPAPRLRLSSLLNPVLLLLIVMLGWERSRI